MYKKNKELNQLLKDIEVGMSDPHPKFKKNLEEKFINTAEGNTNFNIIIFMKNKWIYIVLVALLLVGGGILIYTQLTPKEIITEDNNQNTNNTGIANPASTYCVENEGTLEIDDTQTGYCIFDDGSKCEEWAFFRGECKKGDSK